MMLVESDDLCPESLDKFKTYWLPLKKKHPDLKVTFWTVPKWQNKEENDIRGNLEFVKFYEDNKDWIELQPHGYAHTKPPECEQSMIKQVKLIRASAKLMKPFIEKNKALLWKAPFYHMNNTTLQTLIANGFDGYQNKYYLVPIKLVNNYVFKSTSPVYESLTIISTHTSPESENNADDIAAEGMFNKLDQIFSIYESIRQTYETAGDMIWKLIT